MANPLLNAADWDTITVANVPWEGTVKLSGFGRENDFDVKQAPGAEGGTSTYRGNKLVEGKITLVLWTEDHWFTLPFFLELFRFDPNAKSGQAVDVYHPSFDLMTPPIRGLVAKKIGRPERSKDGDTLYTVDIDCLEYRPPKKKNATSTPKGSSSNVGKTAAGGFLAGAAGAKEPTFDDKQDEQIETLLEKAKSPF